MINKELLVHSIKRLILDKVIPDMSDTMNRVDKSLLFLAKKRKYIPYFRMIGIIKQDEYMDQDEHLYQQMIHHPLYRYTLTDDYHYNTNDWSYNGKVLFESTLKSQYDQYGKCMLNVEKLLMLQKLDVDSILSNKYGLDSRRFTCGSKKRRQEYAHSFTKCLFNKVSNSDIKKLLSNIIELFRSFTFIKGRYCMMQYNSMMDEFMHLVRSSDDGNSGAIKDIHLHVVNSANSIYGDIVSGVFYRLFTMHMSKIYMFLKQLDDSLIDKYNELYCSNKLIYNKDKINKFYDSISKNINNCNNRNLLLAMLNDILCCTKYMVTYVIFNVDDIRCIEIHYDTGKTEYLILDTYNYHCMQSIIYNDREKCCGFDLSYIRKVSGDAIDVNTLWILRSGKIEVFRTNKFGINFSEAVKSFEDELRKVVINFDSDNDSFDDMDIRAKDVNNWRQFIIDRLIDLGLTIGTNNKQFNIMLHVILDSYMCKHVFGFNGENIESINQMTTMIANQKIRSIPMIVNVIEDIEYRYDCNIEWVYLINPVYISRLYGEDTMDMFMKSTMRDAYDTTNLLGLVPGYYNQVFSRMIQKFDKPYLYKCKKFMDGISKLTSSSTYTKKVKKEIIKHRHKLSNSTTRGGSFILQPKIVSTKLSEMTPYKTESSTNATLPVKWDSELVFKAPYLVYVKITDRKTGAPILDFDLKNISDPYKVLFNTNILPMVAKYTNLHDELCKMYFSVANDEDMNKFLKGVCKAIVVAITSINLSLADSINCLRFSNTLNGTLGAIQYYNDDVEYFREGLPFKHIIWSDNHHGKE
jgi:hypothetical protein|nr:MAG TPA: hypothetical protein [Caudoviricetes sp.]